MEQCKTGPCALRLTREGKVVLNLTVHVDDKTVRVAGPRDEVDKLLLVLNEDFTTNNLGDLSFLMGCVFTQDLERGKLSIVESAFSETHARRFDLTTTSLHPASPGADLAAWMEGESGIYYTGTWYQRVSPFGQVPVPVWCVHGTIRGYVHTIPWQACSVHLIRMRNVRSLSCACGAVGCGAWGLLIDTGQRVRNHSTIIAESTTVTAV